MNKRFGRLGWAFIFLVLFSVYVAGKLVGRYEVASGEWVCATGKKICTKAPQ